MPTLYNPDDHNSRVELAIALLQKLEACQFQLEPKEEGTTEKIYYRNINDKIRVVVYTTIVGHQVRSVGKDAIRICALYKANDGTERGIVKETRVNGVGNIEDITQRVYERMREVWARAGRPLTCLHCGSPVFISVKGNSVCAEFCWKKKEEK